MSDFHVEIFIWATDLRGPRQKDHVKAIEKIINQSLYQFSSLRSSFFWYVLIISSLRISFHASDIYYAFFVWRFFLKLLDFVFEFNWHKRHDKPHGKVHYHLQPSANSFSNKTGTKSMQEDLKGVSKTLDIGLYWKQIKLLWTK